MRPALHTLPFLAVLAGACAPVRSDVGPESTLSAFSEALQKGDARRAYGLMSEAYRERVSYADFEKQIKDNPAETEALSRALLKRAHTVTHVEVELADGRQVRLAEGRQGFVVDSPIADFYSQATPRDALETFIRAVENARWDVVYALMPNADREGLDPATLGKNLEAQIEELTRIVTLLKTSRELPIEVVGDRATMPYGESFTARFVREDGRWKLEDPE
jgi:hypothetical protein